MAEIVLDKVSKRYPGVLAVGPFASRQTGPPERSERRSWLRAYRRSRTAERSATDLGPGEWTRAQDITAVSELDVTIADGEFVVLLGPSGCGKSTALHLVAGLESISSGELRIDGQRVNEQPPWQRDLAMVFQSYALYPHLSVRENIAFPLRLAKLGEDIVRARVGEVAERLDLTQQLDRRPATLSGGQRQRVAIGRAIVRNAKALLMDEPMANLDSKLRAQLRASVAELRRELGMTMLYVTHDQAEAMALADRVVVLRDGVVQRIGTPRQLRDTCGE